MSELVENKILINDLLINYVEAGEGTPMIFLHNGGGFWQSWEHQLNYFSNNYHVIAIDWPGFGESQLPDGILSLDLLVNVISSFIEKMNFEKVILVGNCIGASAALDFSIKHPKKVQKLVLFNICPGDLILPSFFFRKFLSTINTKTKTKKITSSIIAFLFTKTAIRNNFPKILFGNNYDEEDNLSKKYIEKFKSSDQTTSRINLLFSVHTYSAKDIIQKAIIPKHKLIWGRENSVTDVEKHGLHHKELLGSKDFSILENGGHLCMYEEAEETNKLIEKYILI